MDPLNTEGTQQSSTEAPGTDGTDQGQADERPAGSDESQQQEQPVGTPAATAGTGDAPAGAIDYDAELAKLDAERKTLAGATATPAPQAAPTAATAFAQAPVGPAQAPANPLDQFVLQSMGNVPEGMTQEHANWVATSMRNLAQAMFNAVGGYMGQRDATGASEHIRVATAAPERAYARELGLDKRLENMVAERSRVGVPVTSRDIDEELARMDKLVQYGRNAQQRAVLEQSKARAGTLSKTRRPTSPGSGAQQRRAPKTLDDVFEAAFEAGFQQ